MLTADRFRDAARAYLVYGIVYWIGGVYLAWHGVGVRGGRAAQAGVLWIVLGLGLVLVIPYLLARRREWFERWVLSRRDFARILTLLMAFRAVEVLRVALRPESATVPAPWGGVISFSAGAWVFFLVTAAALAVVARAAWDRRAEVAPARSQVAPVSGHPRSEPGDVQSQVAPTAGHPRSEPGSRPPLQ
jgi:membrane protease YdiL (CAAX protease family)